MASTTGVKVTFPSKVVVSAAPAPAPTPNPKTAFAAQMSGYTSASPIWGKRVPEVIDMVEKAIDLGSYGEAKTLLQEFRKRIAKGQLIKAQR